MIRHLVDAYNKVRHSLKKRERMILPLAHRPRKPPDAGPACFAQPIPAVLEIPSKDRPYDPAKARCGGTARA